MFQGSMVALVTPMTSQGEIDYPSFESLIEWHIASKTNAIVILGTTGESPTVKRDEREEMIRRAVELVNKRVPVIVGTGSNCTDHTILLTQQAEELGADAVLLVCPYYNKPSQEGLFQHFKRITESVSVPQILYNVPSRTCCDLLPETVARLSEFQNIKAIKEATGDISRVSKLKSLCPELALLSGDDKSALAFLQAGGHGVISVAANITPVLFQALCYAVFSNDHDSAIRIDAKLHSLYHALFVETNPVPVKYALQEMGKISSGIRLPLMPLSAQNQELVARAITELDSSQLQEV